MSRPFILLDDNFYVSPQITSDDISVAREEGIGVIISNRPDGEEPGQPSNASLREMAEEHGLTFIEIPVTQRGVGPAQIAELRDAIAAAETPILAFCRSGTRSAMLHSYVKASLGEPADLILRRTKDAGYDIYTILPGLEAVAPKS